MDVDGLVFTGSTAVGKLLMQCAGRSNLKRAYMECGGKSPNIIFADAPDLDAAGGGAASGIFYNQGEVCTAASALLVERSIKDEFLARVVEAGTRNAATPSVRARGADGRDGGPGPDAAGARLHRNG
jgi:gamma-glutamyl-gamma-aminobutyraldehyde dehydrogenase